MKRQQKQDRPGPVEKTVCKYEWAYRAYADIYAAGRSVKRKVLRKGNPCVTGTTDNQPFRSMRELIVAVEERGAKIYGKHIIEMYEDIPEKTVFLISHELSLSGAPIVLLGMARALRKEGWQTVILSAIDGGLGKTAENEGIPSVVVRGLPETDLIKRARKIFAVAVVNTILGAPVVRRLEGTGTPVLWWIHEAAAVYNSGTARAALRSTADNIHIFCPGDYARRMLISRFPRYKAEELLYYVSEAPGSAAGGTAGSVPCSDGCRTYTCVASMEQRKGQDILLEAIELIPAEMRKKCRFVLAGGVNDKNMKKEAERAKLRHPEQIMIYEDLDREEVYDLYGRTCWLICPSRDDPMPVVVAEAMSLGIPSICSDSAGSAAIVDRYDAGLTYGGNDAWELAKAIESTFRMTEGEYRRHSSNARRAYEETFSEEVFEKNLVEIMKKLTE